MKKVYPESYRRGFALLLVTGLIFSIFILAAVSFKFLSNKKRLSVVIDPTPTAQATTSSKSSPSPSPLDCAYSKHVAIVNKTRDELLTFKAPFGWRDVKNSKEYNMADYVTEEFFDQENISLGQYDQKGLRAYIFVPKCPWTLDLDEIRSDLKTRGGIKSTQELLIDGEKAISYIETYEGWSRKYEIIKNGALVEIWFGGNYENDLNKHKAEIEEFINSIKFK